MTNNATHLVEIPSKIISAISSTVFDSKSAIQLMIATLLSGGHVLLEGPPGSGKTLLARSFASAIGGSFKRVQLTWDTLPADILGFTLYQPNQAPRFLHGPIFANVVMADELNRTSPKTQAAFLEAMQERRATVEGDTYTLPEPFFTIATQLPLGSEGTFPLPEGELDRFSIRIPMSYPNPAVERSILLSADSLESPHVSQVTSPDEILTLRRMVKDVTVSELVAAYIVDLLSHLRSDSDVAAGPSTRAALSLYRMSRAVAFLEGRDYVLPDDVRRLAMSVLLHRIRLKPEAELDDLTPMEVLQRSVDAAPVPKGF